MKNYIKENKKLFTKNKVKGKTVYSERLTTINGEEYRQWLANKSKIAAAILKNLPIDFKIDDKVLYLGAASGTTVSHLSDIIEKGKIFAVEFAPRVLAQLVLISKERKNIFPILGDANQPLQYINIVPQVNVIFQDVAQKNQVEILIKNTKIYLKKEGYAILALKTRSINITKSAKQIHTEVTRELKKYFEKVEFVKLDPYEKDHYTYLCKNFKL